MSEFRICFLQNKIKKSTLDNICSLIWWLHLSVCLTVINLRSVFFFNITSLFDLRTTEQQQRFHDICGNLVKTQRRVVGWWKRLCALKEEKPKMVND